MYLSGRSSCRHGAFIPNPGEKMKCHQTKTLYATYCSYMEGTHGLHPRLIPTLTGIEGPNNSLSTRRCTTRTKNAWSMCAGGARYQDDLDNVPPMSRQCHDNEMAPMETVCRTSGNPITTQAPKTTHAPGMSSKCNHRSDEKLVNTSLPTNQSP